MGRESQIETCFEYFTRQLKEGWRCISLSYPFALLASSGQEKTTKLVNLDNDVETLRPNAAGTYSQLSKANCTLNYQCVDESTPDEDATFVYRYYPNTSYASDTYNLPAHSGSGTINSVTVYSRCMKVAGHGRLTIECLTHGTMYYGSQETLTSSYVTYSKEWTTNPNTGSAWTWAEIDALEIGQKIRAYPISVPTGNEKARCTQTYVEINYTSTEPELAGVIAATSTVSGVLNVDKTLAGAIAATTSVTGTLTKLTPLAGAIIAVSTVQGGIQHIETLRPNATGDLTEITYQYPASGAHWDKVDEATPDDNTTRVYIDNTGSVLTDLYNLPAHSGAGTINSVVIYVRAAAEASANGKLRIMTKTHGVLYESGAASLSTSWATYSTTHTNNPNTSSAWTWDEIDALQIGAKIWDDNSNYEVGVTQVYVEVKYYAPTPLAGVIAGASAVSGGINVALSAAGVVAATSNVVGASTFVYGLSSYTPLYTESFETNFGDWVSSGDLGWTRDSGGTPSTPTGPDSAYDGDWYIYTEASIDGLGFPYKVSYLTYNGALNSFKHVNFWYHKYGVDCGPLELHAYYGGAWHTVWSRPAGSEGNTWFNAIVDFPDGTTNIRFKSTTGDYAFGDTALDLIIIYTGIDVLSTVTGALSILMSLAGVIGATSTVSGLIGLPRALAGTINAQSTITGALLFELSLAGAIAATSTVTGAIDIVRGLTGEIDGASSLTGAIIRDLSLKGIVDTNTTVAGTLTRLKLLTGIIPTVSTLTGTVNIERGLSGVIEAVAELTGAISFVAATRGFYYAKLGTDNLHNPPKISFNITTELNNIASFNYVLQNDAHNRDIIANNLTDDFSIMRDDGTELLRGSIDSDSIEYYTESEGRGRGRIRLSGFANFVDLKYLIYKRMAAGDAENVGSVQDEDNSTSTFTDYTTAANNATINDVILTFGAVNDALYIGKDETFFATKIKYSTKGIQAANTTVVMEYSKGSGIWATLDCIDESYSFTEDAGTYLLYIPNKADDWAKDTVNGKNQYYIRFRITQGSYSTLPKLDQIKLSNTDVCRVQFNDTPADTILTYLLEGTGYTEDATDQCPSTAITIRGEYDSKLRWIFGLGSALAWEDANGDMQRYDCWIDTAKKVHYKQHRGTDQGDISAKFRALSNKIGYGEMGTRIFGTGGQEGINQKKAVVEDLTAQSAHKLREIVLEDNRITAYAGIKEDALKSLANRKNPLKDVTGDLDTKYWLDRTMDVGDKILVHQPDWNLNNQELYVMRAVIGPSATKLDLGNSQIHLEHLRSTLQRQMDIGNVWMHGSVSTYVAGPEEHNYERKDNITAYPLRFTIEVPDNARGINHVEIGWELQDFRSSVDGSAAGGGHTHTTGPSSRTGAHLHNTGPSGGGGAHSHDTDGEGDHVHVITSAGVHWHTVDGTITTQSAEAIKSVGMQTAGGHTHTNPTTSGPSGTTSVIQDIGYGTACTSGNCITGSDPCSVASAGHTHTQGSTGSDGVHHHPLGGTAGYFIYNIAEITGWTSSQHDGHAHPESSEAAHYHITDTETNHAHTIPNTNTEADHEHTIPESSTEVDHNHPIAYGIHDTPGGTTLELYVGDELVGNTYVGNQSGINITGWISTGSNSITLKPIVGDNVKGRAKISAICTVFLENLK